MATSKLPSWEESQPVPANAAPESNALPKWEDTTELPSWNDSKPIDSPEVSADQVADEIIATPKGEWQPQQITPEELQDIAQRTGTPVEKLQSVASYFTGGTPLKGQEPSATELAKGFAGRVGRVASSIPQAVYKKFIADDKDERALDILDALSRKKQSYTADIFDIGAGIAAGAGLAKAANVTSNAAKFALAGPVAGAAASFGSSEKGKELESAATGAAVGAALTAAPQALGLVADKIKRVAGNTVFKAAEKQLREKAPDLEAIYRNFAKENAGKIATVSKALNEVPLNSYEDFAGKASPELLNLLTEQSKAGKNIVAKFIERKKLPAGSEDTVRAYYAAKAIDKDFAKSFGTSVGQIQGRVKPEQMDEMYQNLLRRDIYSQNIGAATKDWSPLKKLMYKTTTYIGAAKPITMMLDDMYGTRLEKIVDQMSEGYNLKYAGPVQALAPKYAEAAKDATDDLGKKIIAGDKSPATMKVREYFANARDRANLLGANIPEAANYFPKMRLPPAEYTKALRNEFTRLQDKVNLNSLDGDKFKAALSQSPELQGFYKAVKDVSPGEEIATGTDLLNRATVLLNSPQEMRSGLHQVMSASLAAGEEELPDFIRDWNTRRVMSRWTNNTFKSLALGEGIRKISTIEKALGKADPTAAKYLRDMRDDLMGGKKGTLSAAVEDVMQRREERLLRAAEATKNPIAKQIYQTQIELPKLGNWLKNWTYTTLLGGRVKPAIQNLTSAYLQNAGDIGYARAQRYMAESSAELASLISSGQIKNYVRKEIYDRGLVAPGWKGEMDSLVSGGKPGGIARAFSKLDDKARDVITSIFTMSEYTARALTAGMGKRLAKDMMTDPKLTSDFLNSLPSRTYRESIGEALKSGNLQNVEDEVIRYMNATNMFNYHKFNQSQFVRDLGPAFGMFTLWPSMAAGRVVKDFVTGNPATASARLAATVGIPFLALSAIDMGLNGTDVKDSPAYQLAFGKSSLADQTLLSAFPTNLEGRSGLISAPVPSTIFQAGKAASEAISSGDTKEASKLGRDVAKTYIPYVSIYNKFINDQLPLLKGELPEKK